MKDMLYAVLGLICVIAAGFSFYRFVSQAEGSASSIPFIGVVIFALAALVLFALFFSGRVNKTEDIHITE